GLQYKVLRQGTGAIAKNDDEVVVKYEGHLIDGTEFDSSYKRDPQTSTFRPNQVIKGWTEALTMMPEGSKWELYIPQNLAYGERQAGKIPPYSTLIFTVELEKVNAK
ncbi:MAG: FKBP-type peptidyl-prolyl cis-trans isomerase, partial [Prevotella sp.]|nr:FKBP-type peptidyl-prolyl cis-trans isomerase [Prevotella sp.]